jgi:hypothetical protein
MDIGPYILPERSTMNVEISPLLYGFIWKFRRIIAQAEIVWLKTFCVIAERHTGGSRSLHARRFRAVLHSPRVATSRVLAGPEGPVDLWSEGVWAQYRLVSAPRRSAAWGTRKAMVPLACQTVIDHERASSRPSPGKHATRASLSSKDVRSGATMAQRPKKRLDHVRDAIRLKHDPRHAAHA